MLSPSYSPSTSAPAAPKTERMSDSDADDDTPMLGMDLPPAPPASSPAGPYRVLARKYRPQTFAELIGQDAMVRTLGNAIARDRLAPAFLMTGVRGVGKTSTERLIAQALNCSGPERKSTRLNPS